MRWVILFDSGLMDRRYRPHTVWLLVATSVTTLGHDKLGFKVRVNNDWVNWIEQNSVESADLWLGHCLILVIFSANGLSIEWTGGSIHLVPSIWFHPPGSIQMIFRLWYFFYDGCWMHCKQLPSSCYQQTKAVLLHFFAYYLTHFESSAEWRCLISLGSRGILKIRWDFW